MAERILNNKLTHSQTIMPMIEGAFAESELSLSDIDMFAVSNGPGSFTGLRIGVSCVKALAHSQNKPCVAVSTLEAMAYNMMYAPYLVCPVMDARRGEFYNGLFRVQNHSLIRLCEDRAIHGDRIAEELAQYENVLILGDGAEKFVQQKPEFLPFLASSELRYQSGESVAKLGFLMMKSGGSIVCNELSPKYLRLPQAEREWNAKNNK